MDLYEEIMTRNPAWTWKEILIALVLLAITCLVAGVLYKKGKISLTQVIAAILMMVFLTIVFSSTVYGPSRHPGERRYQMELFWSYKAIAKGSKTMKIEVILNCFLLMPAGMLLPFVFGKHSKILYGLLFGLVVSAMIELLQLLLCCGLCELDDIIHNTLGCLVGCAVVSWGRFRVTRVSRGRF